MIIKSLVMFHFYVYMAAFSGQVYHSHFKRVKALKTNGIITDS